MFPAPILGHPLAESLIAKHSFVNSPPRPWLTSSLFLVAIFSAFDLSSNAVSTRRSISIRYMECLYDI